MNDWVSQKEGDRLKRERKLFAAECEPRDRTWWQIEARRMKTDRSSLLRQRIKVLGWIRAGRPALKAWKDSCDR
jgi:hypothetical protein